MRRAVTMSAALAALAAPAPALADGPATPQAVAANADFLATTPAPPGGAGAVCVIDSGVDADTDLGPALGERGSVLGAPFDDLGATSDTGVPLPKHGTYVAGVIASQIDGVGSSGIWPASRVVSNRVFAGGRTTAADYIQAINWCQTRPDADVKVINLSIAGLAMTAAERTQLANKIVQTRQVFDINVVAAAGNSGLADLAFPAAFPEVLAVGAAGVSGELASFSNHGPGLDLAAPGAGVCVTTAAGARLGQGEGTSYAAPVVSAVLNALRSYKPALTADAAEAALLDSARVVGGVRLIDARSAFAREGLGHLITSAAPPAEACETVEPAPTGKSQATAPPRPPQAAPSAPDPVVVQVPAEARPVPPVVVPLAPEIDDRMRRPVLRMLRFRRGVLRVGVALPAPADRVVFTVDGKRMVRRAPVLRMRVPTWRRIAVRAQRGHDLSPPLRLRRGREF